jgi:all-trans-retinol dehydrogenase (NAD+)
MLCIRRARRLMESVAGKNIAITGAASGIGRLMALLFAREKANIALVDLNETSLEQVLSEVGKLGVTVKAYVCDISKKQDIDGTAAEIKSDFPRVDILVNNAGIVTGKYTFEAEYEELRKIIDVNLLGLMWMTRQFLPEMMDRNDGQIVNISSLMGLFPVPRMSDYVATKFAIIGYSDTLRIEMKQHKKNGVRVTIVCPGGFDSGMFEGFKAPWICPLLKQEDVAKKIVKAVKKKKDYLKTPFVVKVIPFAKGLPTWLIDRLGAILGLNRAMDHFSGRKE